MIAPQRPPTSDDIDAQLMLRIKGGDLDVFEELVARNQLTVYRFIQHFQTPAIVDHDDLAQQVFFRVYKSRHTYQPTAKFSSWLYTITRNVVSNANRQLARRREVSLQYSPVSDSDTQYNLEISVQADPARDLIRTESRRAVRNAITRLGKRQQTALRLVHFHGYSYLAAAQKLRLTEMALKSLVQRARTGLRKSLEKEYGDNIDELLKSCVSYRRRMCSLKRL